MDWRQAIPATVLALLLAPGAAWARDTVALEATVESAAWVHNDRFGAAVDLAGDLLVVGAPRAGADGEAYVFRRSGTDWIQEATLLPSGQGGPSGGRFGTAVGASGDTVAVGAPWETAGAVYVFVQTAMGWVEETRLTPPAPAAGDGLGLSLSFAGNTIVAGAPGSDAAVADGGAAHVFERASAGWTHQAVLTASDAASLARFGAAVSVSGDTAAVGALMHDNNRGQAYVFARSGTQWSEQAALQPAGLVPGDRVGEAIATDGKTLAVGARYFENGTGSPVGGVFLYALNGSTWTQGQTLLPDPVLIYNAFGTSVALRDGLMVIGAADDDSISSPSGRAVFFRRSGSYWTEREWVLFFKAQFGSGDHFGAAVALDGSRAAVGAPRAWPGSSTVQPGMTSVYTEVPSNAYCTAGISKNGCQAWLCAEGTPSATSPIGFQVQASNVPGGTSGILFFGTNGRQARSWGGSSFQCVVPPVRRAPMKSSVGTVGQCNGGYFVDLNQLWCPACPKPGHNPGPGTLTQAQYWYRDPLSTMTTHTSLSDAVEFTVGL